jgi:hypothetical protein
VAEGVAVAETLASGVLTVFLRFAAGTVAANIGFTDRTNKVRNTAVENRCFIVVF